MFNPELVARFLLAAAEEVLVGVFPPGVQV